MPSHGYDGDRGRSRVGLEPARRLPPVHNGQRQVHQDDVGRGLDGLLEGFHAVRRLNHIEA